MADISRYQTGLWHPPKIGGLRSPISDPHKLGIPHLGLNWDDPRSSLNLNETPWCVNARMVGNGIQPRPGLEEMSSGLDDTVLLMKEFPTTLGAVYYVLITVKSLWMGTNLTNWYRIPWYYTTGTASTTNGSATVSGSSTSWTTNARAGDRFKIDADGTWYTIQSVDSANQITLTSNFSGTYSGQGYHIDRYFGGDESDKFWGVVIPDEDLFAFSQGVDNVCYINQSFDVVSELSSDCSAARCGIVFGNRLVIANLAADEEIFTVKWCASGDWDNWTGTGSGNQPLLNDALGVNALTIQGGVCVVYKERSIHHMTRTGNASSPFAFADVHPGIGLFARGLIASLGTSDVFVSSDDVFEYDLSTPRPIGSKLAKSLLQTLSPTYKHTSHSVIDRLYGEVQFYFPGGASESPDRALIWNFRNRRWDSQWDIPANASGDFRLITSENWDSDEGAWDDDTTIWDDVADQSEFPVVVVAVNNDTGDPVIYKQMPYVSTDGGNPFTFGYEIVDIVPPDVEELSVFRIVVDYYCSVEGAKLGVAVSKDGGETYVSGSSVELDHTSPALMKRAFFDFIETAEVIGAKITCASGLFRIVSLRVEEAPDGEVNP